MPSLLKAEIRQQLLAYAVRLINLRPRFSAEIECKLQNRASQQKWGDQTTLINQIIKLLTRDGFLNDASNLESYLKHQLKDKVKGPRYLRAKLIRLGLPKKQIDQAFTLHLPVSLQLKTLTTYLEKKLTSHQPKVKARLFRRLLGRGFAPTLVLAAFDALGRGE